MNEEQLAQLLAAGKISQHTYDVAMDRLKVGPRQSEMQEGPTVEALNGPAFPPSQASYQPPEQADIAAAAQRYEARQQASDPNAAAIMGNWARQLNNPSPPNPDAVEAARSRARLLGAGMPRDIRPGPTPEPAVGPGGLEMHPELTRDLERSLRSPAPKKGPGLEEALRPKEGNPIAEQNPAFKVGAKGLESQTPGLLKEGNIDLSNRPVVKNADGSVSTVRSISVGIDGKEVLIPTVSSDGRIMSDKEAIAEYKKSGQHLGVFDNSKHADAYANQLHEQQAALYSSPQVVPNSVTSHPVRAVPVDLNKLRYVPPYLKTNYTFQAGQSDEASDRARRQMELDQQAAEDRHAELARRNQEYADAARDNQAWEQNRMAALEEHNARLQRAADDIANTKIDADRYLHSMGTAERVGGILAAGIAGFGAGWNHQQGNIVVDQLNKNIDRDIQAQVESLNSKKAGFAAQNSVYGHYYEAFKDEQQARLAAKMDILDKSSQKVQELVAKYDSPKAQLAGEQMQAQIEAQKQQYGVQLQQLNGQYAALAASSQAAAAANNQKRIDAILKDANELEIDAIKKGTQEGFDKADYVKSRLAELRGDFSGNRAREGFGREKPGKLAPTGGDMTVVNPDTGLSETVTAVDKRGRMRIADNEVNSRRALDELDIMMKYGGWDRMSPTERNKADAAYQLYIASLIKASGEVPTEEAQKRMRAAIPPPSDLYGNTGVYEQEKRRINSLRRATVQANTVPGTVQTPADKGVVPGAAPGGTPGGVEQSQVDRYAMLLKDRNPSLSGARARAQAEAIINGDELAPRDETEAMRRVRAGKEGKAAEPTNVTGEGFSQRRTGF